MFSPEEIDLLLKGLDSIEKSSTAMDMMGDMLTVGLARDDAHREQLKMAREEQQRQRASARRRECMQINILKGKLAQIALSVESDAPFVAVTTLE